MNKQLYKAILIGGGSVKISIQNSTDVWLELPSGANVCFDSLDFQIFLSWLNTINKYEIKKNLKELNQEAIQK